MKRIYNNVKDDDGDYADALFDDDDLDMGDDFDALPRHDDFSNFLPHDDEDAKFKKPAAPSRQPPPPPARLVPFEPKCDVTQQRPGYQVVDNTSYYNLGGLVVLLYAHASEGISIPAVFDAEKQSM